MFDRTQKKLFLLFYMILFTTYISSKDINLKESAISVAENSKDLVYSLGSLLKSIGHECKKGINICHDAFVSYIAHMKEVVSNIKVDVATSEHNLEIILTGFESSEMQNCSAEIEYDRHQFPTAVTINSDDKKSHINIIHNIDSAFVAVKAVRKYEKKEVIVVNGKESEQIVSYKDEANRVVTLEHQQLDLENLVVEFDTVAKTMKIEIPYKEKQKKAITVKVK